MTAPLFHLAPGSLDLATSGVRIRLDGPEGHHAATVMRLGAGELIMLSDARRILVSAEVVDVGPGELTVEVREVSEEAEERPQLVLVQALAKDKRDLQAVESATELGVAAVVPWQAQRSVARWKPGRETKKHAEWVSTTTAAAKQTRRTTVPEVGQLHTTAQYCRMLDDAAQQGRRIGVVALHETESATLSAALRRFGLLEDPGLLDELHLLVGPEGGISPAEIDQLTTASAVTARLGSTVLRCSSAGPAAVAGVQVLLGRWETPQAQTRQAPTP